MTIRLLHLVCPLEHSGAGRQVELLARRLPRDEFASHVVGMGAIGPLAERLREHNVNVHAIPLRSSVNPLAAWRLRRILSRVRPHVIHAWGLRANTLGRLAGGAGRAKWLTTLRGLGAGDDAPGRLTTKLLRRSDRVLASCSTIAELLSGHGVARERVAVIPPAVEFPAITRCGETSTTSLRSADLPPELLRPDAQIILVVGAVDRRRSVHDLMHAYDIMAINWPRLHLVFAGEGPLRRSAAARARHYRAADRIHFLGPRDDVPNLLHRAAALWLADLHEGIPQSLLEALAAGVPVVARETASLREFLTHGETAWLASPDRLMTFCKWQQRLLEDPDEAARIGQAGRDAAQIRFSAEEFVQRHAETYRRIGE